MEPRRGHVIFTKYRAGAGKRPFYPVQHTPRTERVVNYIAAVDFLQLGLQQQETVIIFGDGLNPG